MIEKTVLSVEVFDVFSKFADGIFEVNLAYWNIPLYCLSYTIELCGTSTTLCYGVINIMASC